MIVCERRPTRKDDFGKVGSVTRKVLDLMLMDSDRAADYIAEHCGTTAKSVQCIQCRMRKKFDCSNNRELARLYRIAEG